VDGNLSKDITITAARRAKPARMIKPNLIPKVKPYVNISFLKGYCLLRKEKDQR
jgi:hypothetical protein